MVPENREDYNCTLSGLPLPLESMRRGRHVRGSDEVRGNFVAMQIATGARFNVFAGTPPLNFVELALS